MTSHALRSLFCSRSSSLWTLIKPREKSTVPLGLCDVCNSTDLPPIPVIECCLLTFWFLIHTDLQKVLVDLGSLPAHKRHSYPSPRRPQLHTTTTITWALLAVRLWLRWQVRPDTHGKNNGDVLGEEVPGFLSLTQGIHTKCRASDSPPFFVLNMVECQRCPGGVYFLFSFSSLPSHPSFIALLFSKVVAPCLKINKGKKKVVAQTHLPKQAL